MWLVIAYLVVTIVSVLLVVILGPTKGAKIHAFPWDPGDSARKQVIILGGLTAFAVTGLVLLVTLGSQSDFVVREALSAVIGMFIVAYFSYVGVALMFANLPKIAEKDGIDLLHLQYPLASIQHFQGILFGWLALRPLLEAFEFTGLARLLSGMLLVAVLSGWILTSSGLYRLGFAGARTIIILPLAALLGCAIYAAIVWYVGPQLRTPHAALVMSVVAFANLVITFILYNVLPTICTRPEREEWLGKYWHIVLIARSQMAMVLLGFVWLAVSGLV